MVSRFVNLATRFVSLDSVVYSMCNNLGLDYSHACAQVSYSYTQPLHLSVSVDFFPGNVSGCYDSWMLIDFLALDIIFKLYFVLNKRPDNKSSFNMHSCICQILIHAMVM